MKQSEDMIQALHQELQSKLRDVGEDSDEWVKKFNFQLDKYCGIYATDHYPSSSVGSPRFDKYLRRQYDARLKRLKLKSSDCLRFSQPVYDAIIRTNWYPDPTMWNNYKTEKTVSIAREDLEIVRILIRPKATLQARQELENLDYDHRVFAIPLFVLDSQQLKSDQLVDFVVGFDENGEIIKSYEFVENGTEGKVKEVDPCRRGLDLKKLFDLLLRDGSLKTVKDFIRHGVMIEDLKEAEIFAAKYDKTRKTSRAILEKIRQNINPCPNKVGLDIGCGTGNYTIPFISDFGEVIGLDVSKYMLNEARKKSDRVKWIKADALYTGLPDEYCDAVWLISTLHYFIGDGQRLLFEEIYRILKKGGVVFADIEFKEQHDSLWQVEFFPSLIGRYRNACLSKGQYKTWLSEIGFSNIRFEYLTIEPTENDASLRIGQHNPNRYFEYGITNGIPAFKEMGASEFSQGMQKLKAAIEDGTIYEIIKRYDQKATMKGDDGFIIAARPS